jgi:RNA polymerase sigma-70 factor (ECF subfamily)
VTEPQTPDPSKEATDEDLLEAIAGARDRSAFAALFGRFAGRVKGFLVRSGATPEQAEEIAQEVMVTVWNKAEGFDPQLASAATWIFTIARNRRIDVFRREARPAPDPEDPLFKPEPARDPADTTAAADRDAQVRQVLDSLNDDQREVIRLAFYAGLSHGEIAARLNAPLGTVKSRLRLAFSRLRDELGDAFALELKDD